MVDSLDCQGNQVIHLLEFRLKHTSYLLALSHIATYRFFRKRTDTKPKEMYPAQLKQNNLLSGQESAWVSAGVFSDEHDKFQYHEKEYTKASN